MINLMYLVLTALLALNVSAEVMNAFKTIDESLQNTNNTTNAAIDEQQAQLASLLTDETKAKFRPLGDGIKNIRAIVANFNSEVDAIKAELIDKSGNKNDQVDEGDYLYYGTPKQIIKGKKNKDVTTRVMVGDDSNEGKGEELKNRSSKMLVL